MITLQQGETSLIPNAFDQPVIIRLQRSPCQWATTALMLGAFVFLGIQYGVLPHLLLPFTVIIAHVQGQYSFLPLLKYHRQQWWLFQQSQWHPVKLEPCYIGSWLMSMNIERQNVIVWPDSCSPRARWHLRRALLARQRALLKEGATPSFWMRLCHRIIG